MKLLDFLLNIYGWLATIVGFITVAAFLYLYFQHDISPLDIWHIVNPA